MPQAEAAFVAMQRKMERTMRDTPLRRALGAAAAPPAGDDAAAAGCSDADTAFCAAARAGVIARGDLAVADGEAAVRDDVIHEREVGGGGEPVCVCLFV